MYYPRLAPLIKFKKEGSNSVHAIVVNYSLPLGRLTSHPVPSQACMWIEIGDICTGMHVSNVLRMRWKCASECSSRHC